MRNGRNSRWSSSRFVQKQSSTACCGAHHRSRGSRFCSRTEFNSVWSELFCSLRNSFFFSLFARHVVSVRPDHSCTSHGHTARNSTTSRCSTPQPVSRKMNRVGDSLLHLFDSSSDETCAFDGTAFRQSAGLSVCP